MVPANAYTSWQKADLQYTQYIKGRSYTAEITLLRPTTYFNKNNVTKSGDNLVVNLPEMGLDNVAMNVVDISSYDGIMLENTNDTNQYKQIDEINWENKKYHPVTATFKRYAEVVNTYTFINTKTNKISKINSTPNHPFYVVNKKNYVAIEKVTPNDMLLSQTGELIRLDCPNYVKTSICGTKYNKDNKPTLVYNFEVYDKHRYFVASEKNVDSILVHNPYNLEKKYHSMPNIAIHNFEPKSLYIIEFETAYGTKYTYDMKAKKLKKILGEAIANKPIYANNNIKALEYSNRELIFVDSKVRELEIFSKFSDYEFNMKLISMAKNKKFYENGLISKYPQLGKIVFEYDEFSTNFGHPIVRIKR